MAQAPDYKILEGDTRLELQREVRTWIKSRLCIVQEAKKKHD